MSFAPETETLNDPKALLHVRVGMASPLWPLFAGAAISGAAWWWMTRWTRPANLEAMFGAAAKVEEKVAAETVVLVEPVVEALGEAEPAFEATAEALMEPAAEAVAEPPALEPVLEAPVAPEAVALESAPISPVVEAIALEAPQATEAVAAPKPKKKPPAAPQPAAD